VTAGPAEVERLLAAMTAVTAEKGYDRTRVADLIRAAQMSRKTFYRTFSSKEECLLAAIDAIALAAGRRILDAYRDHEGPWDARLGASLNVGVEMVVVHPAAARLFLVDAYAGGPEATERVERFWRGIERLAGHALRESSRHQGMPSELPRAIVGGVRQILHTRVRGGSENELRPLAPELAAWAFGYRSPAQPLRPSSPSLPEPSPAGESAGPRERIVWAVAEILDRKRYQAMTIADIAQHASISFTTFYAHFKGKEDALIAAMEHGEQQLLAATLPAYQAAPSWPRAVGAGLHAFFAHLSANPVMARLGGFESYSAGDAVRAWRERSIAGFQALLEPGLRAHPGVPKVVSEAVGCTIAAMFYDELRQRRAERLYEIAPLAVYVALSPFVGSQDACAIANGR
jgi:AcrR family transcriptional regulator